jgi:hypothetical protein
MLRAAIPFFEPPYTDALEVAAQMGELQDLISGRRDRTELLFCRDANSSVDMEGLFKAIREFGNEKERRMVDMMINFFQMKRMMEMVKMMQEMQEMQKKSNDMSSKNEQSCSEKKKSSSGEKQDMDAMMEFLKSSMPKDQQDNFDMIQMAMAMMNT